MYMESHLGLMLEQSWDFWVDPLMVILMVSLRDYCFETHWCVLMVKCLDIMKASNWDNIVVKLLVNILGNLY